MERSCWRSSAKAGREYSGALPRIVGELLHGEVMQRGWLPCMLGFLVTQSLPLQQVCATHHAAVRPPACWMPPTSSIVSTDYLSRFCILVIHLSSFAWAWLQSTPLLQACRTPVITVNCKNQKHAYFSRLRRSLCSFSHLKRHHTVHGPFETGTMHHLCCNTTGSLMEMLSKGRCMH